MNRHLSGMGWTAVAWAALAVVVLTGCGKKVSNCISGETPYEVAASLGLGWNLGNQLDAFRDGVAEETAWGNDSVTQELFDGLASAGFTTVRIPVTWNAPDYAVEPAYMDRVAEVVGYAERAGLNVLVNVHHDGDWLDIKRAAADEKVNETVKAQLKAIWTQIAVRFRDKGNFLAFEAMNEIHDGGWGWGNNRKDSGRQYAVMNEWNQAFVDAVRATGGNNADRYLGVPAYVTNIDIAVESFVLPEDKADNRLMLAVHFYDPVDFALNATRSEWGHTGDPAKKASWGDEDNVRAQFGKMKSAFIDKTRVQKRSACIIWNMYARPQRTTGWLLSIGTTAVREAEPRCQACLTVSRASG